MNLKAIQESSLQFLLHDSIIHGCPSIPITVHQFFTKLTPGSHIDINQSLINKSYDEKTYRHLKQQYVQNKRKELQGMPFFTPYLSNSRFRELVVDLYSPFVSHMKTNRLFSRNPNNLFSYLVRYYNYSFQQRLQDKGLKGIFQLMHNYSNRASIGFLVDANWLNFNLGTSNLPHTYVFNLRKPESLNLSKFQDYRAFENVYSLEYQFKMNILLIDQFSNSLSKNRSDNKTKFLIIGENSQNLESLGYKIIKISNGRSNISDLLSKYNANLSNFDIQLDTLLNIYQSLLLKDIIVVNDLEELSSLLKLLTSMIKAD